MPEDPRTLDNINEDVHLSYKSGQLKSHETFTYGRFSTRMQGSDEPGTFASFFTFWDGGNHDTDVPPPEGAHWNEIDFELIGSVRISPLMTNLTWRAGLQDAEFEPGFFPNKDWHVYSFEWTPERVEWFVDGISIRKVTGTPIDHLHYPSHVMMNFWTA